MTHAKYLTPALSLVLLSLVTACQCLSPAKTPGTSAVPQELVQKPYLYEIVRYLYRWQLDEAEVERLVSAKQMIFWVRRLETPLDPGDQSVMAEILLPQVDLILKVKRADYRIEELNTEVKSKTFMITQIAHEEMSCSRPRDAERIEIDMQEMRDYLFRTRAQHDYPDPALIVRLQQALRQEAARKGSITNDLGKEKIVHIAPLSPVANEIWAFWEAGRKLFLFSSDIDLANPAVWQHETLMARQYDLDQQVVVSHEEAPGSNRFLTRNEVSRALFNCLLFGQRLSVKPLENEQSLPNK